MYFKMTGDMGGEPNVYMESLNNDSAQVRDGVFVSDLEDSRIYELPFRFEMQVRRNDDETRQEPRFSAYYYATELMEKRLVEVLQKMGVDNLQTWPAVITESGTDNVIEDYVVVNVVGLVEGAASASSSMPFADGEFFHELVIDPTKTHDLLMFRLAESKLDVLVHESVANELMKHRFQYLVLEPLAESVG